jgi:REP element-mobilizing transposase RayT
MPKHFHVLIWPSPRANPSQLRQSLKERTAQFMLKTLGTNTAFPWCARMLARLKLPPTVHRHGPFRVWQRRLNEAAGAADASRAWSSERGP